jgi:2-polyprenyl-3-methyl-5-hydroxy-6-metoxy-1,4-benzoquinol methylase
MTVARGSEYKAEWYDDIAAGYYDRVYARGKGVQWFWHHYRFTAVAGAIPPSGKSILDIGCGPGTFLGHFAKAYERRVGIDLAAPQIAFAARTYGGPEVEFRQVDLAEIDAANKYDVVTSIEVIEHLPMTETQQFLTSVSRALKDGGTFVLTTPNYRSLWPLIEWVISKKGPVDYLEQHINRFSPTRLVAELRKAGFTVDSCRTFFVIAPFLAAISTRLAELVYRIEQRLLPSFGTEIVLRARKP